jgi:hypothetical protein
MKRLSDETLNAFADGALAEDARAEVEAQLQGDAEARAVLEKLRRANALAIEAFAAPMQEAPPQALIDTIIKRPGQGTAPDRGALRLSQQARAWSVRDYALPLAAALALAVGITAGFVLGRQPVQPPGQLALGPIPAGSTLHLLLEGHPSGSSLEIVGSRGAAGRFSVVATFRDRHARACREVELLAPDSDQQAVMAAVACRHAVAGWVVEGATRLAGAAQTAIQQFEPSGVPEKDALEGLLTMLGAQRALSPAEEKGLIGRGWRD